MDAISAKLSPRLARIERDEVLSALIIDFHRHGAAAIQRLRQEKPEEYLRLAASVLPDDFRVAGGGFRDLTDDELKAVIWCSLVREGIDEQRLGGIVEAWRSEGQPRPAN